MRSFEKEANKPVDINTINTGVNDSFELAYYKKRNIIDLHNQKSYVEIIIGLGKSHINLMKDKVYLVLKSLDKTYVYTIYVITNRRLKCIIDIDEVCKSDYVISLHVSQRKLFKRSTKIYDINERFTVRDVFKSQDVGEFILSIHIPKTGGTTFLNLLEQAFKNHLYLDYPQYRRFIAQENNVMTEESNQNQDVKLSDDVKIVHGHFKASIYINKIPDVRWIAWFRNPVDLFMSLYHHHSRPNKMTSDFAKKVKQEELSIEHYLQDKDCPRNIQSMYSSPLNIDDMTFVGITEEYEKSIRLFGKIFNIPVEQFVIEKKNRNPKKESQSVRYDISDDIRQKIIEHNDLDIQLYKKAKEKFLALCKTHNV